MCEHEHVIPQVCDQTLGVACTDCNTLLTWCWMDKHIPESLWNRACKSDPDSVPCLESRDNVCAICCENIPQSDHN